MSASHRLEKQRFLIIGGATRSGTTSLFAYLSDHPQVRAANMKETRFFLDPKYPLPARYRLSDGLDHYAKLFGDGAPSDEVWVEATSDYLYSPHTAERIRQALPRARVLVVLRDPVARLLSWYWFARRRGDLESGTEFAEYVRGQFAVAPRSGPQHQRALEQGRYSAYLEPYVSAFGPRDLCVIFLEELAADPRSTMREVCRFAGIDPEFYDEYRFALHNPGGEARVVSLHRLYTLFVSGARRFLWGSRGRHVLHPIKRAVDRIYLPLNRRRLGDVRISEPLRAELRAYYADDRQRLEELLHRLPPW
jgi:hypothetical protein